MSNIKPTTSVVLQNFSHAKPPENGQTLPPDIEHKPFEQRILDDFYRKKPDTVLKQKSFFTFVRMMTAETPD
jgi:hypothetical protein